MKNSDIFKQVWDKIYKIVNGNIPDYDRDFQFSLYFNENTRISLLSVSCRGYFENNKAFGKTPLFFEAPILSNGFKDVLGTELYVPAELKTKIDKQRDEDEYSCIFHVDSTTPIEDIYTLLDYNTVDWKYSFGTMLKDIERRLMVHLCFNGNQRLIPNMIADIKYNLSTIDVTNIQILHKKRRRLCL